MGVENGSVKVDGWELRLGWLRWMDGGWEELVGWGEVVAEEMKWSVFRIWRLMEVVDGSWEKWIKDIKIDLYGLVK